MDSYARLLFSVAAVFNYVVGAAFLLAMPQLAAAIGMHPLPSDPLLIHFGAVLVLVFGWGYQRVAIDPVANRPIIYMGIMGKSAVVLAGYVDWYLDNTNSAFPMLLLADVLFALLFADYLRRRPAEPLSAEFQA